MFELLPSNPEESMNAQFVFNTQSHAESLLLAIFASYNYNRDIYYIMERLRVGDNVYGSKSNSRQKNILLKQQNLQIANTYEQGQQKQNVLVTNRINEISLELECTNSNKLLQKKLRKNYIFSKKDSNPPQATTGKNM